ncbi:fumarylacetoacetate hydrolase family protein [Streptomyces sp. NPDC001617]
MAACDEESGRVSTPALRIRQGSNPSFWRDVPDGRHGIRRGRLAPDARRRGPLDPHILRHVHPHGTPLVIPDEVGPPEALELRCSVEGTLRQHARVANLIRDVPRLQSYTSSAVRLIPGDVVTTGTFAASVPAR